MEEINQSLFQKIRASIWTNRLGIILLLFSATSVILSGFLFFQVHAYEAKTDLVVKETLHNDESEVSKFESKENPVQITVDISGAVKNPGAISIAEGSRLYEALEAAGGLRADAAFTYVSTNFNQAKVLADQEKVYIPSQAEVDEGLFTDKTFFLKDTDVKTQEAKPQKDNNISSGVSINDASSDELESLSGVGPVTAKKIIDNRPYQNQEDLLGKDVISENLYQKIKDSISL